MYIFIFDSQFRYFVDVIHIYLIIVNKSIYIYI